MELLYTSEKHFDLVRTGLPPPKLYNGLPDVSIRAHSSLSLNSLAFPQNSSDKDLEEELFGKSDDESGDPLASDVPAPDGNPEPVRAGRFANKAVKPSVKIENARIANYSFIDGLLYHIEWDS